MEYKINNWYITTDDRKCLFYITKLLYNEDTSEDEVYGYGFNWRGDWINDDSKFYTTGLDIDNNERLATSGELTARFIEEAKRRDYRSGNFTYVNGKSKSLVALNIDGFRYSTSHNGLWGTGSDNTPKDFLFRNGKWADKASIEEPKSIELIDGVYYKFARHQNSILKYNDSKHTHGFWLGTYGNSWSFSSAIGMELATKDEVEALYIAEAIKRIGDKGVRCMHWCDDMINIKEVTDWKYSMSEDCLRYDLKNGCGAMFTKGDWAKTFTPKVFETEVNLSKDEVELKEIIKIEKDMEYDDECYDDEYWDDEVIQEEADGEIELLKMMFQEAEMTANPSTHYTSPKTKFDEKLTMVKRKNKRRI